MSNTQRQFTLVGNFTDNITPSLNSINNTLNQLRQNFASLSQSVTPLNRSLSQLSRTSRNFGQSLSSRTTQINAVTTALNNYTRAANAANRASLNLNRSGGGGGGPTGGGGGNRGGYGGGRSGRFYGGDSFAGQMVSYQLANDISNAVLRGFQMGVSLMEKPFQYAIGAFGERMKDEMSDIQAAGGMLAISKRKGLDLFPSFASAMRELQKINHRLAESAAALPGSTEEYVRQGKLVTDTVMTVMGKDPAGFTKLGQEMGAKVGDRMDSMGVLIQKLTEKAVLLQQGNVTRSVYGAPQLIEQLINAPTVGPGMFNRYVAFKNNPILMNAFQDPKLQKELREASSGSVERFRAVFKLLEMALPNEVIQAYRNSLSGFSEAFRSSFLDPEVGLFGLGRKFKGISRSVDEFGRYLNKEGKLAKNSAEIYMESYSLFELFSQTIKGFGLPLSEITSILPEIWDPLRGLAEVMVPLAGVAQEFYRNFNSYVKGFEEFAKGIGLGSKIGQEIKRTAGARGFVLALTNMMRALDPKNYGVDKFYKVLSQLKDPKTNLASLTRDLFIDLFQTRLPYLVGKTIGEMVGSVIKILGDIMSGATEITSTGPFAEGLIDGWNKAKGSEGVKQVFSSLFKVIGGTLLTLFQTAPREMLALTALTVGMPVIQNVIVFGLITLFSHLGNFIRGGLSSGSLLREVRIGAVARRGVDARMTGFSAVSPRNWTGGLDMLTWFRMFPRTVGARFASGLRAVSSRLLILGGIISTISAIMNGKNLLEAIATGLGNAGGTAIGAAIGTVILPVIGTWVGAFLGSQLGEMKEVVEPITTALRDFWGTIVYTGALISQMWKDLENSIRGIKGVGKDFSILGYAINLLLSPFTLLKLGILGLTEAYLVAKKNMPFVGGLSKEEQKYLNDTTYARRKGTAEYTNRVDFRSKESQIKAIKDRLSSISKNKDVFSRDEAEILNLRLRDLQSTKSKPTSGSTSVPPTAAGPAQIADSATSNMRTAANTGKIERKTSEQVTNTTRVAQNTKNSASILGNIKSALFVISEKINILNDMLYALDQISFTLKNKGPEYPPIPSLPPGKGPSTVGSMSGSLGDLEVLAGLFGLTTTSGYRPGDPGWHGLNRARDFSNGFAPTPEMMNFAKHIASSMGSNLLELVYTPLGWGIKNGKVVDNSFWGQKTLNDHYNHVHVAMAMGPSNPAFFATRQQAEEWERKMMPVGARVTSLTANSSEGFGTTHVNAPITIYQQPGQDPEELAAIVVARLNMAVQQMRNHYA